jgi:adenosylmethionine-8-amino-7-oxononanoate aminotransferase
MWDVKTSGGVGHGESSVSLALAATASRYGTASGTFSLDVVHAPSIALSKRLLDGNKWADRVLFTQDSCAARNAAMHLGVQLYQSRHGLEKENKDNVEYVIIGKYEKLEGDKGSILEVPPTVGFHKGELIISYSSRDRSVDSLSQLFDVQRRVGNELYNEYVEMISNLWERYEQSNHHKQRVIGSVILQAMFHESKLVDPLWQRAMIDVAQSKRVPVILEKRASGLYQFGVQNTIDILQAKPEIACFDLSTSGQPVVATLTTDEVFHASQVSDSSAGHGPFSLTPHPIACVSALHEFETYQDFAASSASSGRQQLFEEKYIRLLSQLPLVQESIALINSLAVTMVRIKDGTSGNVRIMENLMRDLRRVDVYVHAEVQDNSNILTLTVSPWTSPDECERLCDILYQTIDRMVDKSI